MSRPIRYIVLCLVIGLLVGGGAWWYLYGPNLVPAAELVPGDAIAFATIPNATRLLGDYETSRLKTVMDSPGAQSLRAMAQGQIGGRNAELLVALLPELSGQSFVALTRPDPALPDRPSFIAAMRPKPGLDHFDDFVAKVKTAYAAELQGATIAAGQVDGVAYQSLQVAGAPDKICVARAGGWIVTTSGEAPLHDFLSRLRHNATSPNLAQNPVYQKEITRAGPATEIFAFADVPALLKAAHDRLPPGPLATAAAARLGTATTAALSVRFEGGEIVDDLSLLGPPAGTMAAPCLFDSLSFTGTDTRLYWAANTDWNAAWTRAQSGEPLSPVDLPARLLDFLHVWTDGTGVDFAHNVVGALGPEYSFQVEWAEGDSYPSVGLFAKVARPADLKPALAALIEHVRTTYANSAVVNEITSGDRTFATLKFITPLPVSPTITEDGDWLGLFSSGNEAVRSFARSDSVGLLHDPEFLRQIGDRRQGASQLLFVDTPRLADQGYHNVLPYLSLAAMINPTAGKWVRDHPLPPDLGWLAPIGHWSLIITPGPDGLQVHSISGAGNQGNLFALGASALGDIPFVADQLHRMPTFRPPPPPPSPALSPPAPPSPSPAATAPATPEPVSPGIAPPSAPAGVTNFPAAADPAHASPGP